MVPVGAKHSPILPVASLLSSPGSSAGSIDPIADGNLIG